MWYCLWNSWIMSKRRIKALMVSTTLMEEENFQAMGATFAVRQ